MGEGLSLKSPGSKRGKDTRK